MTVKDVVAELLERGNAMQTYWGFYITVALGLVLFFGNAKESSQLRSLATLVSVIFIVFAWVNCSGMTAVSAQRNFLYDVLVQTGSSTGVQAGSPADATIAEGFARLAKPDAPNIVRGFHVFVDLAVLSAIWFLTLRKS